MTLDQGGLCQFLHGSDTATFGLSAFAVAFPATAAMGRISQSSFGRLENNAQTNLSLLDQSDHDREFIILSSKPARAVDRINDPYSRASLRNMRRWVSRFF